MAFNGKTLLICNCEETMPLDGGVLAKACGGETPPVANQLCRAQLDTFRRALRDGSPLLVACTQEAPLFAKVATDGKPGAEVVYANIREKAGWSEQAGEATPKIVALLAEAALDGPPTKTIRMKTEGVVAVYGRDEKAIEAAKQLARDTETVVLLDDPQEVMPPSLTDAPIFRGTVKAARGHLGAFELSLDGYAAARPSSRRELAFETPTDGKRWTCSLILDLTGGAALFPAPEKRDGYFNPDPKNPALVQRAIFDLAAMVGDFEKPQYIDFDAALCAHSRARLTGCTRCLDLCPTDAIEPAGDHVAIDAHVCAGCGNCAAVCPTGAASYAMPAGNFLLERPRVLLRAFHEAGGGDNPVLLVHDERRGSETIDLIARQGRGLPARVLPFAVNEITQLGFDFFAVALAYGVGQVRLLSVGGEADELVGLSQSIVLANAIAGGLGYGAARIALIDDEDPAIVEDRLYELAPRGGSKRADFLPAGGKRTATLLALHHLHAHAPHPVDSLTLPDGAPFGTFEVDTAACSMCFSCVGACPTGALQGSADTLRLSFVEDACVQCGLCRATCPEKIVTLTPRINFTDTTRDPAVIKQDEPFACVRCGNPFGIKSFVETVVGKLAGAPDAAIENLKMCDRCRVEATHHIDDGGRPT